MKTTKFSSTPSKAALLAALRAFVNQRSGIDFRNYQTGDYAASRAAFMGDYRPILRNGRHAREMLRAIEWRDSITAEDILAAARSAFSGRLSFVVKGDKVGVDYCTGQYFATEYRAAACAVLASVLWDYWRNSIPVLQKAGENITNAGDYIRKTARRELGRGIAARWFN